MKAPLPEMAGAEAQGGAEQLLRRAQQDLSERLGLAPDMVQVISVEAVEWPDASLGCPKPGMMYAQVITPGFRIVLEAEGQAYEYHTDQERLVVLCESAGGTGESPSKGVDTNVQDGWPSQPIRGGEVERRVFTPTPRK